MTDYEKTMKDNHGDPVVVAATLDDGELCLTVREGGAEASALFTPQRARKLAKALRRAADVAEGKPEKEEAADAPASPFKVGDRVRIGSSPYLGSLPDGPVSGGDGVVTNVRDGSNRTRVRFRNGENLGFWPDSLEPFVEARRAPRTVADFPVGSYARVSVDRPSSRPGGVRGSHAVGDVVEVLRLDPWATGRSVHTRRLSDGTTWYIDPAQLEPLKLTPCKAIVPCLGETADGEHLMPDGTVL